MVPLESLWDCNDCSRSSNPQVGLAGKLMQNYSIYTNNVSIFVLENGMRGLCLQRCNQVALVCRLFSESC